MEKLAEQIVACNVETDTLAVTLKAFEDGLISKEDLNTLTVIDPEVSFVEKRKAILKCVHAGLERKLANYHQPEVQANAIQAVREGLIKDVVREHLDSLHSEIPYSMRSRYLLQFVHQSLLEQFNIIKKRALLLMPFELEKDPLMLAKNAYKKGLIEECVLDYLVSLYPKTSYHFRHTRLHGLYKHFMEEKKKYLIKNLGAKAISLSNPSSIASSVSESLIVPEKLSKLYKLLEKYAYKWKSIGIALNFVWEDLENIQASPLHAPQGHLCELLKKWLSKEFNYTLPPSIDSLKKALNSQMVGLGSLVNELDNTLCKSILEPVINPAFCIINVDSSFPKSIVLQVKERASTLLEIQATQCEAYQWQKDGVDLPSTRPIFCLHQADIDWDGCELSCQLQHKAKTPIITVQVSCILDVPKTHLTSMYLAQPEVPQESWPPVKKLKYTNLALVGQEEVDYNSEYARLTIRGNLDDILQDKQIIAYNATNFFKNFLKSGNLVFIEGRPGSGKTTFVHKLAQDWAVKSGGSVRLLLLVSLRVLNTINNPDLSDILKLFEGLQVSKDTIEQRLGKGVCFIFDGFDELSSQNKLQSSVVNRLINKKYLPHSIVIISSRHAATARLRHKADTMLEVVGFLNEQIFEYIDRYPFKTSTKSAELKPYLEMHPHILHMCYLPIHAAMIAYLFERLGKVPRTETEIYTYFTRSTLTRYLTNKSEVEVDNINLDSLTGDEEVCLKQICQLAFEKMLCNEQVLKQTDVDSHFQVKKTIVSSLGLITVDCTADLYGYKSIYTFMHLTFQEYLAAYYITTLSDEEQMKLIQEYGDKDHMLVVWKFYCGLIKIKPLGNKFKSILNKSKDNLFQIQCGYETQQQIACELLLKLANYHIMLTDKYLSTSDFTALGYVTNSASMTTKLSLLNCNMNVEAIDVFLSEMDDRARDSIHDLNIHTGTIDDSQMECLKKLLRNLKSLKALSLEANETKLSYYTEKSNITLSNLSELSLTNVDPMMQLLSASTIAHLSNLYYKGSNMKVQCLSLTINLSVLKLQSLHMKQFDFFCKCTSNWKKLQALDVLFEQSPSLNSNDSKLLFQFCRSSEALTIKNCFCRLALPTGLKAGLQWSLNIQELDLSNNYITADIIREMLISLRKFSCLKELHINSSHITDHSLKALSLMLRHYSRLQKLSLSNNIISNSGCYVLADNLHFCSNLEKLNLRNNSISNAGATAIISSLKSSSRFQELVLLQNPCNYICIEGNQELTFSILLSCN